MIGTNFCPFCWDFDNGDGDERGQAGTKAEPADETETDKTAMNDGKTAGAGKTDKTVLEDDKAAA